VDVSGAIDVARHPRVATLELLLAHQSHYSFERYPRTEKLFFISPLPSLSQYLAPTKAFKVIAFAIFSSEH